MEKKKPLFLKKNLPTTCLYIKKVDDDKYLYSAELRSVSENISKPIRTFSVKICAPSSKFTNKQIVVNIPNVRSPVPLICCFPSSWNYFRQGYYFLLFVRSWINMKVLLIYLFLPFMMVGNIMTQQNALKFIALLTKGKGISHALEILNDYFLPHVGETNYIAKAYALGDIVHRLLLVYNGSELPTDRDNFKYKRIELVGSLINDLFREYWNIQLKKCTSRI